MEIAKRKTILENVILHYVRQGYRVIAQTENTAQLVKPKHFSLLVAIIAFFVYVVPFVIYLFYYLGERDETVYVLITDQGKVSLTHENGQTQLVDSTEQIPQIRSETVPDENAPGQATSTRTALAILAIILVVVITAIIVAVITL